MHEKARVLLRLEQLSNVNYLNQLLTQTEKVDTEIMQCKVQTRKNALRERLTSDEIVKV